eukprot:m.68199 g.68199  ORF g.68199 m.68199 type:complete len:302 (+) comp11948_c0_seq1:347-1252(+)
MSTQRKHPQRRASFTPGGFFDNSYHGAKMDASKPRVARRLAATPLYRASSRPSPARMQTSLNMTTPRHTQTPQNQYSFAKHEKSVHGRIASLREELHELEAETEPMEQGRSEMHGRAAGFFSSLQEELKKDEMNNNELKREQYLAHPIPSVYVQSSEDGMEDDSKDAGRVKLNFNETLDRPKRKPSKHTPNYKDKLRDVDSESTTSSVIDDTVDFILQTCAQQNACLFEFLIEYCCSENPDVDIVSKLITAVRRELRSTKSESEALLADRAILKKRLKRALNSNKTLQHLHCNNNNNKSLF